MLRIQQLNRLPSVALVNIDFKNTIFDLRLSSMYRDFIVILLCDLFLQLRHYSSAKKDQEKVIPKNLMEGKFQAIESQPNGPIVDNKPFKLTLKAGSIHDQKF